MELPLNVPGISQEALEVFHQAHFSTTLTSSFSEEFLGPVGYPQEQYDGDDLGYYHDGVKRTLTDEQVAIFRHSEIEAILRRRRNAEEEREGENEFQSYDKDLEDGEIKVGGFEDVSTGDQNMNIATPPTSQNHRKLSKKARKLQTAKEKGFFKQHVKPDLRKRTWDIVESGMDSLAYDEEPGVAADPGRQPQRRRISYDD